MNILNIIDGLRRILDAYDGGSEYDVYEDVDIADIAAITPPKKTKKKRQPSAYQIFVGEQMQLPEIKEIELFKKRMQLLALFWKDKKKMMEGFHKMQIMRRLNDHKLNWEILWRRCLE